MAFSKIEDTAFVIRRRAVRPLLDGSQHVQELGYTEQRSIRYFWITTAELQQEIVGMEAEVSAGWVLDGEPNRVPIQDPLDLYNVVVNLRRMTATA
jgi:hypothetical protein